MFCFAWSRWGQQQSLTLCGCRVLPGRGEGACSCLGPPQTPQRRLLSPNKWGFCHLSGPVQPTYDSLQPSPLGLLDDAQSSIESTVADITRVGGWTGGLPESAGGRMAGGWVGGCRGG